MTAANVSYAVLVQNVTQDDKNLFAIQNAFFPPNSSSPVFVTVSYDPDNGSGVILVSICILPAAAIACFSVHITRTPNCKPHRFI